MAVLFPVHDVDESGATAKIEDWGGSEKISWTRSLPGGGVFQWQGIGAGEATQVGRLELSLPKRVGADNVEGLPLDEARLALSDAYGEVIKDFARTETNVSEARVSRLDVVRDFDNVGSFSLWASGMRSVRQDRRAIVAMMRSGEFGGALTLGVGPRYGWRSYCYDKHEESHGVAPEGRVRFEARMRREVLHSRWAQEHGGKVVNVADLEEEKLRLYTRGMFSRVGFDREVSAVGTVYEAVMGMTDVSEAEKLTLLGYMWDRALGGRARPSAPTERKYEKLAKRLGVAMPAEALDGRDVMVSLDFDRGEEVLRAA